MTNKMLNEKTSVLYQTRYCAQEDFSVAVCMKRSIKILELPFITNHYQKINQKGFKTNVSNNSKIVACDSNLYVVKETGTFKSYYNSSKNKKNLSSLLDKR